MVWRGGTFEIGGCASARQLECGAALRRRLLARAELSFWRALAGRLVLLSLDGL